MSLSGKFAKRALAVGAVSALGLGGLLVASPAAAASTEVAPTDGPEYAAFAAETIESNPNIQAVAKDANGDLVVIAVAESTEERTAVEGTFEGYSNVAEINYISEPLQSFAATDVVGGAGYFTLQSETSGFSCSIGFTAWTPSGADAVLSAGHCTKDGTLASPILTLPSSEPAHTGNPDAPVTLVAPLGDFGFSQYGGVGNTVGAENTDSIDVAVIDVTNAALNLKPEITDWSSAASNDLSLSATQVTAVGHAAVGMPVSKSGRTTGLTSDSGIDYIDGWANIGGRLVYGFGTDGLVAAPGDSGGAVFSGTTALGILSGGSPAEGSTPVFLWASDLQNSLAHTNGYTVRLFVAAPVVTTAAGAEVVRGTAITGTGPISTEIVVTAGGTEQTVTTDAAGNWSFLAPSTLGAYPFSVQAKNGFNLSTVVESTVTVVAAPLVAPVITAPANGAQLTDDVTTLTGTGLPGAVVTVAGDAAGTATIAADGTFSVTLDATLSLGSHELTVTQASEGEISPVATTAFSIVLVAPAIVTPATGSTFELADAPTSVSGTGVEGATVTVSIDGVIVGDTVVVDGSWTVEILAALKAGAHSITATQSVDGVTSLVATSAITINAPAVVTPAEPGDNGNGGGLAETGVETLPLIGGAMALLLAGAAFFMVRRRSTITE